MRVRPGGQPPKPTELKVMEGNPGKRKLPKPVRVTMPDGIPKPPAGLGPDGLAMWKRIWVNAAGWLALSDYDTVRLLCTSEDTVAAIQAKVAEEGLLHIAEKSKRSASHWLLNDLRGLWKEQLVLLTQLGLTPAERARMPREPEAPKDAAGKWMEANG